MRINNNFNVLPFYDSLQKQNSKKWYSFGQHFPLICPNNTILPFQFIIDSQITVSSNIEAVSVNNGKVTNLGVQPSVIEGTQAGATYYIVKMAETTINAMPEGLHYLRINTNQGYLYSEEFTYKKNHEECIKIEYWNENTLNFTSGEINFDDGFRFIMYIPSTIGKPEYEFEEELTKRLGYKFIESQTSNKLYKFNLLAPEYICDAMRLIRLCDYIKLTTKYDTFNALSFAYEPKWQEQGDLAAVECEFETDCIIQKLESFNRRLKESFYNALLSELDEPILFSTDTIAQYYNEFTSIAIINGKLIRHLDAMQIVELRENIPNIFLPVDNISDDNQKAKKLSISDLLALSNISDISKLFKGHFDKDGNLLWIEALSHIGVNGGVTMFIDNGTMSLPQLYSGLPIDWKTLIRDNNGVLMINPDIEFGGGASSWGELEGKPEWITNTKPTYDYSEINGTPDLSKYALSDDLKKYVPINEYTEIIGLKNFTKGLQIDGLGITKSQDDVIYINGNLAVRGGITMYATDAIDVPSIIDALPIASSSAKGIASFNPNDFSVVDGYVSFIGKGGVDDSVLSNYLPLSGGQMNGGIGYTLSPDSYVVGLPASGTFEYTSLEDFNNKRSFIGTIKNATNNHWSNFILIRHGNGAYSDSTSHGMYLIAPLLSNGNLSWANQYNGNWQGERVILDSHNWSQYVTAGDGGNYLPLSGGTVYGTLDVTGSFRVSGVLNAEIYRTDGLAPGLFFGSSTWGDKGAYLGATLVDGTAFPNWYNQSGIGGRIVCYFNDSIPMNLNVNGYVKASDSFIGNYGDGSEQYLSLHPNGNAYLRTPLELYVQSTATIMDKLTVESKTGSSLIKNSSSRYVLEITSSGATSSVMTFNGTENNEGAQVGYNHSSQVLYLFNYGAYRYNSQGITSIGIDGYSRFYISRTGVGDYDNYFAMRIDANSNMLVAGGITMYSDIRKKTKLQDVELTLQQIADAPLIEHYYNSDENRTTHVGSIAQYWAETIGNDWFCKLDSEGYYTMEIQNAALASAISIARELSRYETATDKKIRELKNRIKQLECKINQLKSS